VGDVRARYKDIGEPKNYHFLVVVVIVNCFLFLERGGINNIHTDIKGRPVGYDGGGQHASHRTLAENFQRPLLLRAIEEPPKSYNCRSSHEWRAGPLP
jgi:hypothetical protein